MWASSVLCCLKHVSLSVGNTVQASRQLPGGESSPSRPVTLAKGPPCSDTSSSSLMTPAEVWGLGCEPVLLGTPLLLSHSSVSDSVIPRPVARQAPLSTGFSREGCCGGLPCPPPGDLPNPGIEPASPVAPALQVDSLLLSHRGSPVHGCHVTYNDCVPLFAWGSEPCCINLTSRSAGDR